MKQKHMSKPSKLAALLLGASLLGLVSQSAMALTPVAGSLIANTATLAYSVGTGAAAVPQTPIDSSPTGNKNPGAGNGTATTFVVDAKINLLVTGGTVTSVVPGQNQVGTPFVLANTGNATMAYNLTATNVVANGTVVGAATDTFNPTAGTTIYQENPAAVGAIAGVLDPTDTLVTSIASLAPGATVNLLVVTNIPLAAPLALVNGDAAVVTLTAAAVYPAVALMQPGEVAPTGAVPGAAPVNTGAATAGVDVVLADLATVAPAAVDAAANAIYAANGAFKVVSAVINVAKTSAILCDPFNGSGANAKSIPGSVVQYAITVTNTGASAANLTTMTDTLAASLLADANLVTGAGAAATAATTCSSTTGTPLFGAGQGFGAVAGAVAVGTPVGGTFTTYVAGGAAGQAVTAGAAVAGQAVTITYTSLTGAALATLVGGVLPANSFVTVYFNAVVQ